LDYKEIWWEDIDSSGLGQGPVAGCCEHGNEPSYSVKSKKKILITLVYIGIATKALVHRVEIRLRLAVRVFKEEKEKKCEE
jgi:hypothetical protein